MIQKLVRQMLAAQILAALTVSVCLLIDNIIIGRYLGIVGLAAYSLSSPVLLVIGAISSMLTAGVQVACSRSLGKGSQEETNIGYSTAVGVAAVFSIVFVLIVVIFRTPLSAALGAAGDDALLNDTRAYMTGFVIGAPASMGALILVPFLQMAGQMGLLVTAVLSMTVADIVLDLLNVMVFHGGMFGMGLASAISYYIAMIIGLCYFASKKSVFKFSLRRIRREKVIELVAGGVPTVVGMAASVVLIVALNKILMAAGGTVATGAYSVVNSLSNAFNSLSMGVGGVALTLSGILAGEEDLTGLKQLLRQLIRDAVILGLIGGAVLVATAPACVKLYIPDGGESRDIAVLGLRAFALGMAPCCVISALTSSYQGLGKLKTMETISVVEHAVLPVLAALLLSALSGVNGIWYYYVAAEALTLIGILIYVRLRAGRFPFDAGDMLLLPDGFGVPAGNLMEADIKGMEDVVAVSRRAEEFCLAHGGDAHLAGRVALCLEEMAGNVVSHGFSPKGENHLSVRVQYKEERWTIRFRDDCGAFDPIHYVPSGEAGEFVGIRLLLGMADEARYTYSMNLNNLTVVLKAR